MFSVLRVFGTLNWTRTLNSFRVIVAPLLALAACLLTALRILIPGKHAGALEALRAPLAGRSPALPEQNAVRDRQELRQYRRGDAPEGSSGPRSHNAPCSLAVVHSSQHWEWFAGPRWLAFQLPLGLGR